MIDESNIPNDKPSAEAYLKAMRTAYYELQNELVEFNIATPASLTGLIHNKIEHINKLLSGESDE